MNKCQIIYSTAFIIAYMFYLQQNVKILLSKFKLYITR